MVDRQLNDKVAVTSSRVASELNDRLQVGLKKGL